MTHMTASRKLRKRDFRKMWISRISAGVKEHGINYSRFTHQMVRSNVVLNRKILSQLAIFEPSTFKAMTYLSMAKERGNRGLNGLLDPVPANPHVLRRVKLAHKLKAEDEKWGKYQPGPIPQEDRKELGVA